MTVPDYVSKAPVVVCRFLYTGVGSKRVLVETQRYRLASWVDNDGSNVALQTLRGMSSRKGHMHIDFVTRRMASCLLCHKIRESSNLVTKVSDIDIPWIADEDIGLVEAQFHLLPVLYLLIPIPLIVPKKIILSSAQVQILRGSDAVPAGIRVCKNPKERKPKSEKVSQNGDLTGVPYAVDDNEFDLFFRIRFRLKS